MVAQVDRQMLRLRPFKALTRVLCWAIWEGRPLTTRGRWLNPLIMWGYKSAQLFPIRKESEGPLFVIGTGRSGTTVLGKLLSMHKDLIFLNEPKALWHFSCEKDDVIGSYSSDVGSFRLEGVGATPDVANKFKHVYSLLMFLTRTKKVVDKYPECVFRVKFIQKILPEARFIGIRRNGVDTCASVNLWSKRHGSSQNGEVHDWWGKDDRKWRIMVHELVSEHADLKAINSELEKTTDHTDRAAVEWIISMREIEKLMVDYPRRLLSISYESLCSNPEKILGEIQRFAGISDDQIPTVYAAAILNDSEPYPNIELMPGLVTPFVDTLTAMGYEDSVHRISARKLN